MSTLTVVSLNRAADAILGSGTPATVYARLFTGATDGLNGGTEVTGPSYAAVSVTNNATNFPAAAGGAKSNANAIVFPTSGGAWSGGTGINCVRMYDAATGGTLQAGSLLTDTVGATINLYVTGAGQTITLPAAALTLTVTS